MSFPLLGERGKPHLPTNIVDFEGVDSSIISILKGWNSHVQREITGKLESSNVSRDNVSREIGGRDSTIRVRDKGMHMLYGIT